MARGNGAALAAWRAFAAPYLVGLKPFSSAWHAAQKRAAADWQSGEHRRNPDEGSDGTSFGGALETIQEGSEFGFGLFFGITAACAGLYWLGNAISRATRARAARQQDPFKAQITRSGL